MTTLSWPAWGTTASLSVTDPAALHAAARLARGVLARSEKSADRRNPPAEIHRLDRSAGRPVRVSRRLAAMVAAGLDAARLSGGLVDPTVGNAVVLAEAGAGTRASAGAGVGHTPPLRDGSWAPICTGAVPPISKPAIGWQSIDLDGRCVTVPPGVLLDLTALGKAVTVQHCAELISRRLGIGVQIALGGDLTACGPTPDPGWPVIGRLGPVLPGTGLATVRGPVVDPRTGRIARGAWASVTVRRGGSQGGLVVAKTMAVAAAVLGPAAALWLNEQGVDRSSRLLTATQSLPLPDPHDPAELRTPTGATRS